jgi:hypothetical protein
VNAVGVYLVNISMWLDEGCNVVILPIIRMFRFIPKDPALGSAHFTVSQWAAYAATGDSRFAKMFCKFLTVIFKPFGHWNDPKYNHCWSAIHYPDGSLIPSSESEG